MNRTDIFYFAPDPITVEHVRAAVHSAGATTNFDGGDEFNICFGEGDSLLTHWTRFDPNRASELGFLDHAELIVFLEREVRFGLFGEKIRDPALPGTARFLSHLLLALGGFVGFDTDGWEPIFTAETIEEMIEFFS